MPATVPAGRVGRATASAVLVAGLAVVAATGPDGHTPPVLVALGAVVVVHVLGLVRNRVGVYPWVIAALAGLAVVGHGVGMGVDAAAPFAAGLVLAAELAYWSSERVTPMAAEPGVDTRRWLAVVLLVPASVVAALGVALLATRATSAGTVVEGLGVVAAVAVVAVGAALARHGTAARSRDRRPAEPPATP